MELYSQQGLWIVWSNRVMISGRSSCCCVSQMYIYIFFFWHNKQSAL